MSIEISVITAVYNDEKYISKSVESILNQTFINFEYIIVNDGSTDNTLNILKEIAQKDERVTIITQSNLGPSLARNAAIKLAKGKYIALQDSDDISSSDRLKIQLNHLNNAKHNVISCTSYNVINLNDIVITTNNKFYGNINENILKGSFCVCHPSIMLSKELFLNIQGYNPFYKKSEDYDLIYRLLENGAVFEKINSCLYNLRIRYNSEGSMNNGAYPKRVYENHLKRIKNKPENLKDISGNNKPTKNHPIKREASELFYSENYSNYRIFYLKNISKLPVNNFLSYYAFSLLPSKLKKLIKSRFHS